MSVSVLASTATPVAGRRYSATAQALHWVSAALMFTALPLAWVMVNMAHTMPAREGLVGLHKSVGMTVLALTAMRLAWRAAHPPVPLPGRLAPWERATAVASHWLLYLILVGMPVSGFLLSAASGHPVIYFGLFTLPGLPHDQALAHAGRWLHVALGQWLTYALILLHLAATAWHVAVRRDGVLERMLPEQARRGGG